MGLNTDLINTFSRTALLLPNNVDGSYDIEASPEPFRQNITTTDIVITKGYHEYDSWRVDLINIFADKTAYEALGLAIVSTFLSNEEKSTTIKILNPLSEIIEIEIIAVRRKILSAEFVPVKFSYFPDVPNKHPWDKDIDSYDLPTTKLTRLSGSLLSESDWLSRNKLVGFGNSQGMLRMAQLLLDISRPTFRRCEIALECNAGNQGVSPASAEVRLWLPGGDAPLEMFPRTHLRET